MNNTNARVAMLQPARVRRLLEEHGSCKPQKLSSWKGKIPLPKALEAFYERVGPVNIRITLPVYDFFLPSLSQLWKRQEGYRWDGATGKQDPFWDPDWIVVAQKNLDPFIFHTANKRILVAEHGMGYWDPVEMYPDVLSMAASMAMLGSLIKRGNYDRKEALTQLQKVIGSAARARRVLDYIGWL